MGARGAELLSGWRRAARHRGAPALLPSAPCMPDAASLSRETGAESAPRGSGGQPGLVVVVVGEQSEDVWSAPGCAHLAE